MTRLWRQFLTETGWSRTVPCSQVPEDRHGRALPWFTYPAVSFLSERVQPTFRVFEYGSASRPCGGHRGSPRSSPLNMTRSGRCESDDESTNVTVLHQPRGAAYQQAPVQSGGMFDVVVICGRTSATVSHALHARRVPRTNGAYWCGTTRTWPVWARPELVHERWVPAHRLHWPWARQHIELDNGRAVSASQLPRHLMRAYRGQSPIVARGRRSRRSRTARWPAIGGRAGSIRVRGATAWRHLQPTAGGPGGDLGLQSPGLGRPARSA